MAPPYKNTPALQDLIDDALAQTAPGRCVWVALSGGMDSSLLLSLAADACRRVPRPLFALHVHHGLQSANDDFERHCRWLCSRLGVPLIVEHVCVDNGRGEGVEAAARRARYDAFAQHIGCGETLWLAQHQNDQAETFLLAALRGSGVAGLASMPRRRTFFGITIERPLLGVALTQLEEEAHKQRLVWVNDPTNSELQFDRNYVRHRVLNALEARWPHAQAALARSAGLVGEAAGLLDELADHDLMQLGGQPQQLTVSELLQLSEPRRRLLIRRCLTHLGLALPPARRLATLDAQLQGRTDGQAHVSWPGGEARLWRGKLFLMAPPLALAGDWQVEWCGQKVLPTPLGNLRRGLVADSGQAVSLQVCARRGGEVLHLAERGRRGLKRLLQEHGLSPWQRKQLLVVWHDNAVVAVGLVDGEWLLVAQGWYQPSSVSGR
ncbi:tRNA lysidine(34) synthetase TilS [Halomonas halocynthiae]|uniref:tRNA lysidine(34) synthetase TilS n=1 Tax=Halomonas halocynthiae TaxID=176290 RepID=UPI0004192A2A|nr:tRNA lysidine(34) synthetase TilS [Halomonas halocynthiae]